MGGYNVAALTRLVEQFERMPGIGHKSAQRIAFYVLGLSKSEAEALADSIIQAHEKIHRCGICCNLTDRELCPICSAQSRDKSTICVVEDPRDVMAFERTHGICFPERLYSIRTSSRVWNLHPFIIRNVHNS